MLPNFLFPVSAIILFPNFSSQRDLPRSPVSFIDYYYFPISFSFHSYPITSFLSPSVLPYSCISSSSSPIACFITSFPLPIFFLRSLAPEVPLGFKRVVVPPLIIHPQLLNPFLYASFSFSLFLVSHPLPSHHFTVNLCLSIQ